MACGVIWKPNGASKSGCSVISLRRRVVRSKQEGRRALRRQPGQGTNLDLPANEQARTALGELGGGIDCVGLDDRIAADD